MTEQATERFLVLIRDVQEATPLPATVSVAVLLGQLFSDAPGVSDTALLRLVMLGRVHDALSAPVKAIFEFQLDGMVKSYRTNLVKPPTKRTP